jgi:hypothetical protein
MAVKASGQPVNPIEGLSARIQFNLHDLPAELRPLTMPRTKHYATDPLAEAVLNRIVRKLESLGLLTTPARSDSFHTSSTAFSEDLIISFSLTDIKDVNWVWEIGVLCFRETSRSNWFWKSKFVAPTDREVAIRAKVLRSVTLSLQDELNVTDLIWKSGNPELPGSGTE